MTNSYTSNNIHNCGGKMVKCPKCGHEWELGFTCRRCGHKWVPRLPNKKPEVSPNFKSPYWDRPRQNENKDGTQK